MKTALPILLLIGLSACFALAQEPAAPGPETAPPAGEPAVAEAPPALAPKIVCPAPVFDFGESNNTGAVEHDFPIRNEGTLSLEIREVRATCGCTAAKPTQNVIPPGGEAAIHVRFDLRGRNGFQQKAILVHSSDPQTPQLNLQLKGTAIQALRANPPTIFFGRLEPGASRTRTFDVISGRGPIQIANIRTDNPGILVRQVELDFVGDGSTYRFEMTLSPDLPEGAVNGGAFIKTDMEGMAEVHVPIAAFIVQPAPAPDPAPASPAEPPPVPAS